MPEDTAETWGFAPPPFNPQAALERLQRDLRQWRLNARNGGGSCARVFELRGCPVLDARVEDGTLVVRLAKSPTLHSPQWQEKRLRDHAQVRDFLALTQKTLSAWSDSDD
jgi:hypothetical protein